MIDPRAIVAPSAVIHDDVEVGPFSIIGAEVEIGSGSRIGPHVVVNGPTRIGRDNQIFQFCSIGDVPQDKKYAGESTRLEIGDRNVIREYCTLNRGTVQDAGITRVGNDNWIMAYAHIAHDCDIGNNTIFANAASLAGHVVVGDYAILGGFTAVHQFCSIGEHSFSGLGSIVVKDVPPYVTLSGNPARPRGVNTEGLRRRGFESDALRRIRQAYKLLYKSNLKLEQARVKIAEMTGEGPELEPLVRFLETSTRSIIR